MTDPAERVAAGARFLDTNVPSWHENINITTLDMACGGRCMLSQAYGAGDWATAKSRSDVYAPRTIQYGFDINDREESYDELRELWIQEIAKRQPAPQSALQTLIATEEELAGGFTGAMTPIYTVTVNGEPRKATWAAAKVLLSELAPGNYEVTAK